MRIGREITGIFPIEGDEDGATVEVRLLSNGEEDDIREEMEAVKTTFQKDKDGNFVPNLEANAKMGDKRYLRIARATKSWSNFFAVDEAGEFILDEAGNKVEKECNDSNKIEAARCDDRYPKTVIKGLEELKKIREGQKAAEVKNS